MKVKSQMVVWWCYQISANTRCIRILYVCLCVCAMVYVTLEDTNALIMA